MIARINRLGGLAAGVALLAEFAGQGQVIQWQLDRSREPKIQVVKPGATVEVLAPKTPTSKRFQWRRNGQALIGETRPLLRLESVRALTHGCSYEVAIEDEGDVTLSQPGWLMVEEGQKAKMADTFAERPIRVEPEALISAMSRGASKEPGEPMHAGFKGGKSVWLSWRAPGNGIAHFSTAGTTFDTLLAVYTGTIIDALEPVASDEDSGRFYTSDIRFNARKGVQYQVAVDGFAGDSGNIVLSWQLRRNGGIVPVIVGQPESVAVTNKGSATFAVRARAEVPLKYQWKFNGQLIRGATEASFSQANVTRKQVGRYTVEVRAGREVVESAPAFLDLGPTPDARLVDKVEMLFDGSEHQMPPDFGNIVIQPVHWDVAGPGFVSVSAGSIQILTANQGLTQSREPNCCGKTVTGTLFARVRPTQPGMLRVDTLGSAPLDTMLRLRTPNNPTQPLCNDDVNGTTQSKTNCLAEANKNYLITVGKKQSRADNPSAAVTVNVVLEP